MSTDWKIPIDGKYYSAPGKVNFYRVDAEQAKKYEEKVIAEVGQVNAARAAILFLLKQMGDAVTTSLLTKEAAEKILSSAIENLLAQGLDLDLAAVLREFPTDRQDSWIARYARGEV